MDASAAIGALPIIATTGVALTATGTYAALHRNSNLFGRVLSRLPGDGMRVALMTTVTLFASAVLAAAARIRHDVGLAVVVACSLWLYTEAVKRGARPLHVLAGLMIGLGLRRW